jgi:hypothetical protein
MSQGHVMQVSLFYSLSNEHNILTGISGDLDRRLTRRTCSLINVVELGTL